MEAENKHKFKLLISRIKKCTREKDFNKEISMWGLNTLEDIPAGAFVVEYTGEVFTKRQGDKKGKEYDALGQSYLFDMNEPDEQDTFEMDV